MSDAQANEIIEPGPPVGVSASLDGPEPAFKGLAQTACPMDGILRIIMGPWTTYILWLLHSQGPMRFGKLRRAIPGISSKVLTERLRHLAAHGLIDRFYRPTVPPEVTYSLTERGQSLRSVLDGLNGLALTWASEDAARVTTTKDERAA
jgi:DNA-binding HxlR family transcriptional regulator